MDKKEILIWGTWIIIFVSLFTWRAIIGFTDIDDKAFPALLTMLIGFILLYKIYYVLFSVIEENSPKKWIIVAFSVLLVGLLPVVIGSIIHYFNSF